LTIPRLVRGMVAVAVLAWGGSRADALKVPCTPTSIARRRGWLILLRKRLRWPACYVGSMFLRRWVPKAPLQTAPKGPEMRSSVPVATSALAETPPVTEEMLTEAQVLDRLTVNSPELVAELLALVQGELAAETGRQTRIDAKATSLLTAAGLSLTVAFTFGGLLLTRDNSFSFGHWVTLIFALALVCGLSAAVHAVWALLVRGEYKALDGETLFDVGTLAQANDVLKDDTDTPDKEKREFGVMEYRKFLIPNLWGVVRDHRMVHDDKAKIIKRGQLFFLSFLGLLIVISLFIEFVVSFRQ
jgi:hypothetical protein